tara:strand:- start:507 stop:698 length:192 start_codon:yes stop_codon:yes gene_type:complete
MIIAIAINTNKEVAINTLILLLIIDTAYFDEKFSINYPILSEKINFVIYEFISFSTKIFNYVT